ncbi:MAG: DUF2934 domain-containing protein [Opitutaceae bacterium]|nr:DUF2934 domain-containing protein [Opitutaceae bacterium]
MTTHSHDLVAHCAYQIWQESGRPCGRDDSIWFEAERSLDAGFSRAGPLPAAVAVTDPVLGESHSDHALAEAAAQQRKEARAPITAHKSAPKAKPPETGKPLWNQPHSS